MQLIIDTTLCDRYTLLIDRVTEQLKERRNERTNHSRNERTIPHMYIMIVLLHDKGRADEVLFIFLGCRAKVDLAFVIDGSGSIEAYGKGNFRRCLNFVKAIVRRFNINNGQTRVGIVLFSSRPRRIFGFNRFRRKYQVLNAISRIRYPRGGTKTGYAMRYCYSRVFRYARRGVRKVCLSLECFDSLSPIKKNPS